jgi:RNA recognition motif-containing protein
MSKKLFVGNLAFSTTSEDLEALFAESGTCESATVITDRERSLAWVRLRRDEFDERGRDGHHTVERPRRRWPTDQRQRGKGSRGR